MQRVARATTPAGDVIAGGWWISTCDLAALVAHDKGQTRKVRLLEDVESRQGAGPWQVIGYTVGGLAVGAAVGLVAGLLL